MFFELVKDVFTTLVLGDVADKETHVGHRQVYLQVLATLYLIAIELVSGKKRRKRRK